MWACLKGKRKRTVFLWTERASKELEITESQNHIRAHPVKRRLWIGLQLVLQSTWILLTWIVAAFLDSSVLMKPELLDFLHWLCCIVPVYLLGLKTGYIVWNCIFFAFNLCTIVFLSSAVTDYGINTWGVSECGECVNQTLTSQNKQTNKQTKSIVLFIGKENVEFIGWVKLQFKFFNVNCYLTWGIQGGPTKQHITKIFRKDSRKSQFYLYQYFYVLKWVMS